MKRFAQVIIERLQATRLRLLDVYGDVRRADARGAGPMLPEPFRVARPTPGDRRHLDARARAARPASAARVRARAVQHALCVRRGRGADLDQRRSATVTARPHGARRRRGDRGDLRRRAGDVLASAGRSAAPGRSRRPRARDVVIVAGGVGLAPLRPVDLRGAGAPRALRPRRRCSTAAARPSSCSTADELERWRGALRRRGRRHGRHRGADWRGQVGVVTTLIAARRLRPGRRVALVCGPEVMMRFAAAALLERGVAAERDLRLDGAQHEVRGRPLRPLPARARRSSAATARCSATTRRRAAARGAGALMAATEAQARGLEVRLLRRLPAQPARLRGRAARARRRGRDRLLPRGDGARRSRARTTSRWSRARSRRRRTPSASSEVRASSRRLVTIGACATAGGIQALRNFADVEEFVVGRLRDARVHLDARHLDADQRARARSTSSCAAARSTSTSCSR